MKSFVRYGFKWRLSLGVMHPPNGHVAYNPTLAFYTQPSGLESKYAYILQ